MFSLQRRNSPRGFRAATAALLLIAAMRLLAAGAWAQPADASPVASSDRVLGSFDEIWQLPQAEQQQWHAVRLNYVVYYYDALWQAMWGRSGESESYLSLGTKVFPITAGQRILVEGVMRPARGMRVENPKVTILEEVVPLTPISTKGDVGNTERYSKRLVTIEGYVDRQTARDANHVEISLIAEGRPVLVQLLLKNDTAAPMLRDKFIRAKGVYFARSDDGRGGAKIEIWVQRSEDLEVLGTLERDPRFDLPATPLAGLLSQPEDKLVRVVGSVQSERPGESLTISEGIGEVVVQTAQMLTVRPGEQVEAVGFPGQDGTATVLRQSLVRAVHPAFTSMDQVWQLPDTERQGRRRARFEIVVYYFDPIWRGLWGRIGGFDDYISLGDYNFPLKPGQRILLEGSLNLGSNSVDSPRVTVLEESVPIEVLSTTGAVRDTNQFQKHMVTVEGYVDRQGPSLNRHVQLDMVVDGRAVVGRLLHAEDAVIPNWEGARLRLRGVYSATQDPTGGEPNIEVWVQGAEHVQVVGSIETEKEFDLPATPIEKLSAAEPGKRVRVVGVGRSQQPGRTLTVRDGTGQVTLHTPQTRPVPLGEPVEAIGFPVLEGAEWRLQEALYRRSREAIPPPPEGLPRLRLADQLRELSAEEAARSYPVQISGLITWARPNADFFFILDASGGVCVYRSPEQREPLFVGTKVDVTGVTAAGEFTPVVLAANVALTSPVELPEPRRVTLEQALTGIEEGQWVSMSGYVRSVEREGPWARFELTTSAGEFQAMLPPNSRWEKLPGSVVRLRGVCSAVANSKRQLTGIKLWVASSRFVDVEEAAPEDPFAVAARPIASLRQFGSPQMLNRRVRVAGVVVHHEPGRLVHIQEGSEGLLVLSRDTAVLTPGDRIEAVGFPGREHSRAVLREAVYRRTAAGTEPAAVVVPNLTEIDPELDGRLVRLESTLIDFGTHDKGVELINQQGSVVFSARLAGGAAIVGDEWVPGSEIQLTGVYQIQFDEYRRPYEVSLQLRSPADVVVLRRASWWTVRRVLAMAGMLAVAVVLGWGWAIALRRRVREQTGVIREQFEKEKAARLEAALARASKLESLGVLAGGIAHDFNNLLTVIIGNVSLAKLDEKIESETVHCLSESERAAMRARDLTQQLLTFAKGGAPMRMATRLPDVVREAVHFALHGSKARPDFEIAPDLWPADVDRGQIGQVVNNIVINAAQAMPAGGTIRVALRNEEIVEGRSGLPAGRYVRLSFTDTGAGIAGEALPRIFEPYFTTKKQGSGLGLATVYSIVKKHEGHIEVTSKPGHGTTFQVWVPAAAEAPAVSAPDKRAGTPKTGRVLLMDDEESIRLVASTVLKRIGLEVTAVSDGAAAVSEYAAGIAAGRPFDLVVLDLTVPGGMGGAEAMERLREMNPEVAAIVSSGYSSDPVMANFSEHGFRARVPKPYAADDLINVVKKLMRDAQRHATEV